MQTKLYTVAKKNEYNLFATGVQTKKAVAPMGKEPRHSRKKTNWKKAQQLLFQMPLLVLALLLLLVLAPLVPVVLARKLAPVLAPLLAVAVLLVLALLVLEVLLVAVAVLALAAVLVAAAGAAGDFCVSACPRPAQLEKNMCRQFFFHTEGRHKPSFPRWEKRYFSIASSFFPTGVQS